MWPGPPSAAPQAHAARPARPVCLQPQGTRLAWSAASVAAADAAARVLQTKMHPATPGTCDAMQLVSAASLSPVAADSPSAVSACSSRLVDSSTPMQRLMWGAARATCSSAWPVPHPASMNTLQHRGLHGICSAVPSNICALRLHWPTCALSVALLPRARRPSHNWGGGGGLTGLQMDAGMDAQPPRSRPTCPDPCPGGAACCPLPQAAAPHMCWIHLQGRHWHLAFCMLHAVPHTAPPAAVDQLLRLLLAQSLAHTRAAAGSRM